MDCVCLQILQLICCGLSSDEDHPLNLVVLIYLYFAFSLPQKEDFWGSTFSFFWFQKLDGSSKILLFIKVESAFQKNQRYYLFIFRKNYKFPQTTKN